MEVAVIALGMIVAVMVLVLFSSARMRTQGPRGPQGQFGPNQGSASWPQQPGNYPSTQQRQSNQGSPGFFGGGQSRGGSSGLMQFFALIGVLVIIGACGLLFLALQSGIQ